VKSQNAELAAISEKSIKETRYHVKWSSEWVIRLGDGTSESHLRMINAQQDLNPYIAELFLSADFDYEAESSGAGILPEILKDEWYEHINKTFETATLPPISAEKKAMHILSAKRVHSEHLGFLLAERQPKELIQAAPEWKSGSLKWNLK
jgi:ring-1,2-phenylacetyl-CoA epoxidase subunit PaaC